MAAFNYNDTAFRAQFPQFSNTQTFPEATLQAYWDTAGNYIANQSDWSMTDSQKQLALNLMTAQLAALSVIISDGQTPGLVQSATIDKITVTLTPPPVKTQFQWWLSLTPYGQQLLALFQTESVGGYYFGGSAPRLGFRNPGVCW